MADEFSQLSTVLDGVPGTVSVWYGPLGGPPAYARLADATHYAASMMKIAVLVALYRAADAGELDLDAEVAVRNEFRTAAAAGGGYAIGPDGDPEPWARLGGTASLRWLAERMIVRSSNLAANLALAHVGLARVDEVWRLVDSGGSRVERGIEDVAARATGATNLVTAAGLAALLGAIAAPEDDAAPEPDAPLATPASRREMLDVLCAQQIRDDLAAGLPAETRVAVKNGWVNGVRHAAGVVFPADAPPYILSTCTTTPLSGDAARSLITRVARTSWRLRTAIPAR